MKPGFLGRATTSVRSVVSSARSGITGLGRSSARWFDRLRPLLLDGFRPTQLKWHNSLPPHSRPRRSNKQLLTAVRWFFFVWAITEVGMEFLVDPVTTHPIRIASFMIVSWPIIFLSTYRPGLAALLGAFVMMAATVTGGAYPALNVWLLVPIAVWAGASVPVACLTTLGYSAIIVVDQLDRGSSLLESVREPFNIAVFTMVVGLAIRLLLARSRWAGRQIRDVEAAAVRLREAERSALAGELTGLLATGLAEQRQHLGHARTVTDPNILRRLLDRTAIGAREALSQLRGLVATLRDGAGEPVSAMEAVGLEETVDEIDELLTGHGFHVESDSSGMQTRPSALVSRLLGQLLRTAGARVFASACPGDPCVVTLRSDDGETRVQFTSPSVTDGPDFREVRQRIGTMGGSMRMIDGGGVEATMPAQPVIDRQDEPVELPGRRKWDAETVVRVVLTVVLALGSVARAVQWSSDPEAATILWCVFLAGLAVVLWWPLWGSVPVAAVFLLETWVLEPSVIVGVGNLPYLCLMTMAVAYRPWWAVPFLLIGFVRSADWFGEVNVNVFLGPLVYGAVGILAGYTARYFLEVRAEQRTQLSDAKAEREDARNRVRRELAGELHDVVAYQLTLITLHVDAHRGEMDPGVLRGAVERTDEILASAQADLAFLFHLLRVPGGEAGSGGRSANTPFTDAKSANYMSSPLAMVQAAAKALRVSGRKVEVSVDPTVDDADPTTRRTLARVIREASTNILRYAPPRATCTIAIERDDENTWVTVRNPLSVVPVQSKDSTGLGLVGLAERLRLTGGELTAGEINDQWVVKAQVPAVGNRLLGENDRTPTSPH